MEKDYVRKKIENCEKLVKNATSEAQKEIYQSYLDLWTKKLPVKERPETIAKKAVAELKKAETKAKKEAEEEAKAFELKKQAEAKAEAEKLRAAEIKAVKIAAKKAELAALEAEEAEILETVGNQMEDRGLGDVWKDINEKIEAIPHEIEMANLFEIENPGKKAYRTQNGDRFQTIAFKKFLNPETQ